MPDEVKRRVTDHFVRLCTDAIAHLESDTKKLLSTSIPKVLGAIMNYKVFFNSGGDKAFESLLSQITTRYECVVQIIIDKLIGLRDNQDTQMFMNQQ